jgi:DNA invertase Pin-like site-specific DNA recombinase
MEDTAYVAYLRVSTQRQGTSGLGLHAQQEIIRKHLNGNSPIAEFIEVESGRKSDRPKLTKLWNYAKRKRQR